MKHIQKLKALLIPTLILLFAFAVAITHYSHPAQASGAYVVTLDWVYMSDQWYEPPFSWGDCASIQCNGPDDVGNSCTSSTISPFNSCYNGDSGNCGNETDSSYSCKGPPACVPDNSPAASTCTTTTYSDGCGAQVQGSKVCGPVCSPSTGQSCPTSSNACGATGAGVVQCDGSCAGSPPAAVDQCPSDAGLQCTVSECSVPQICTANASCAAATCNDGSTCSDSCGNVYAGTKVCAAPPVTTCADAGLLGSPYPSGCFAPPADTTCADIGELGSPYPSGCYVDPGDSGSAAPTATLAASPLTVPTGTAATITWTSADTTSCTGTNFSTGGATSGSVSTGPLNTSTTYRLTCTGPDGTVTPPAVTVVTTGGVCSNAGPVTVTATPNRVQSGVPTSITFTSRAQNASGVCTLSGPGIITQNYTPSSCSFGPTPYTSTLTLAAQSVYTLTCPGGQPADKNTVIVNVVPKFKEF